MFERTTRRIHVLNTFIRARKPTKRATSAPLFKRRNVRRQASLLLLLFAVALACDPRLGRHAPPSELRTVKVRLKWSHHVQFAGFYVAKERGYYRANGLDVQLLPAVSVSGTNSTEMPPIQMVASGEDHFGLTGPESILLARGKGLRIKAMAAIFQQSPFCYIALKSEGIRTLEDLK